MRIFQSVLVKTARSFYNIANRLEERKLFSYDPESEYTYALGATLVNDLLHKNTVRINRLIARDYPQNEKMFEEALQSARDAGVPIDYKKMKNPPPGVSRPYSMAVELVKPQEPIRPGNHVLLVEPSLEGNLGAIMRTALAFGIKDIGVIPGEHHLDDCSPRVIRTSMSARLYLRVEKFPTLEAYMERFPENKRYAFMLRNASPLSEVVRETPFTLILGNETMGLPDEYADICKGVFIEQDDAVDSLNIGNAASIGIYEFTRNTPGKK